MRRKLVKLRLSEDKATPSGSRCTATRGIPMFAHRLFHCLVLSLASSIALTAHCGEAVASEAPRNGDYLAKLSGLTQLSVDNADQAAITWTRRATLPVSSATNTSPPPENLMRFG